MKRVLSLFILSFSFLFQGSAQQLTEGFENNVFPAGGWVSYLVQGFSLWVRSTDKSHTGVASVYNKAEVDFNGSETATEKWLVSPKVVNIKSGDKISFWIAPDLVGGIPAPDYDKLQVYISEAGNQVADFTDPMVDETDIGTLSSGFHFVEISIPAAYVGKDVYVGLRHIEQYGNGIYIDDFSAGSAEPDDALVSGTNVNVDKIFETGATISFDATVFNNGTNAIASGVPVSYQVNGGPALSVNTSVSLNAGASTTVSFNGSNAFVPSAAGVYLLKVYTQLSGDQVKGNDTTFIRITVQDARNVFPYFTNFENPSGWSQPDGKQWAITGSWINGGVVNPSGLAGKMAVANTFDPNTEDHSFTLRSPLLDFTGVSKPIVNFFVSVYTEAYQLSGDAFNDSLEVLVSTDGGLTYDALYKKSNRTAPELRTVLEPFNGPRLNFQPEDSSQWRLEMVDLSDYAGDANVMVAFRVWAKTGLNVWLDNVTIVDQPTAIYNAAEIVSAGGDVPGAFGSVVHFNLIPSGIVDSIRIQGHTSLTGEPTPRTNTTATGPDGTITSPNLIHPKFLTAAYTGNTENKAEFDISFDLINYPEIATENWGQTYIVWRADRDGTWQALPTTGSGSEIMTSDQKLFGDYGVGYYSKAVPVTILSFSGRPMKSLIALNWTTSQEANIKSYDVEKWDGSNWKDIGNVPSLAWSAQNDYLFNDVNPAAGINLYRLKINGETAQVSYSEIVKVLYSNSISVVHPNVPNPVKDFTIIRYEIAASANVTIGIYDAYGRQVSVIENTRRAPGSYQVRWQADNVPAGNYYYRAVIGNDIFTGKMLKVR